MADPVSDLFIRIKNAKKAGHQTVRVPYSFYKHEIIKALERSGFVGEAMRKGKRIKKLLEIPLIERQGAPAFSDVALLSKPSRRLFVSSRSLPRPQRGGVVLMTTSRGVMTSEEARKQKIGGQVIAEVW